MPYSPLLDPPRGCKEIGTAAEGHLLDNLQHADLINIYISCPMLLFSKQVASKN
jgi:hypothetical protein